MSYLKFDKNLMINLEQSLTKEMLRTNKSGAYHCTSIIGCNTRKQHGLLVIPIPELGSDNHVLLSTLDETVIQHGAEFNLGIHKYGNECYSPKGHKYIREFDCETVPRSIYRVGGVLLSKEKIFISHENRILIRYTLMEANSPTILRFKPFLAFRNVNALVQENNAIDRRVNSEKNGISMSLYPGYPTLYMQLDREAVFVSQPDWYRGIEYPKEQERGYPYKEDLFVPGYFEVSIKKGESIVFSAGVSAVDPSLLGKTYDKEIASRTLRDNFFNSLKNAAQQFYLKTPKNELYLLAGYPWFHVRARDMFIALNGATVSIEDQEAYHAIMKQGIKALEQQMSKPESHPVMQEIDMPDIPLWALRSLQLYAREVSVSSCAEKYGSFIEKLIQCIAGGKYHGLMIQEDGLLSVNGAKSAVSWMNASVGGRPVTPRTGLLVEINALWYNALMFAVELLPESKKRSSWEKLALKVKEAFRQTFMNGHGYLFDYVDGLYMDWSVRPNMLFAIGLDYSPLEKKERKQVLDVVTRELLTPKGIRSLSPKSYGYNPIYMGSQEQRDYAYHQGTAWPWLMGIYADAYLKIFGLSGVAFIERMMIGFEEEMMNNGIGTLSELYDGNPPYTGRGAISFAINVAEILRVQKLLRQYY